MQVIILCGGKGTRLHEATGTRPKPLVEIGGRPILWHIMQGYAAAGFNDFVLCLGYLGHMIKDYFLRYEEFNSDFTIDLKTRQRTIIRPHRENWRVTLVDTGQETQTAERLLRVLPFLKGSTAMVTYGDGVADVDLRALVKFHRRQKRLGTVTGVHPASRFGELQLDGNKVTAFSEKPQVDDGWINGGFFIFQREFFTRYLKAGVMLEREPLERLAADGQLAVYRHEGFWRCMDTYRDWQSLSEQYARGDAPWLRGGKA